MAAVLMGVTGVMLAGTGVWALTFDGSMSKQLRGALNGHTLTSAGVLVLVLGLVLLVCVAGVLIGPRVNRWVGLVARLAGMLVAAVAAFSGIYAVNYACYTAAIAGAVLIAMDLPHPTNLAAEGRRIFYTFAGIAIAIVVMFLATLLKKRKAPAAAPQGAETSAGKDPAT